MLGVLFNESVTVRRAIARTARDKITYQQVLDSTGFPLTLKVRLDRRGRRIFALTGHEKESDAQMVWKDTALIVVQDEDLIVTSAGETFKVMSIDRQTQLGTAIEYGRAQLRRTETPVPEDKSGS